MTHGDDTPVPHLDYLYRESPIHVRSNSNLPGHTILAMAQLEKIGQAFEAKRESLESAKPGDYDPEHKHDTECHLSVRVMNSTAWRVFSCGKWNFGESGMGEDDNPARELSWTYLQLSPAENMKRSEQTTRGFMGSQAGPRIEGVGEAPNLYPQNLPGQAQVIIQTGQSEYQKVRRGFLKRR